MAITAIEINGNTNGAHAALRSMRITPSSDPAVIAYKEASKLLLRYQTDKSSLSEDETKTLGNHLAKLNKTSIFWIINAFKAYEKFATPAEKGSSVSEITKAKAEFESLYPSIFNLKNASGQHTSNISTDKPHVFALNELCFEFLETMHGENNLECKDPKNSIYSAALGQYDSNSLSLASITHLFNRDPMIYSALLCLIKQSLESDGRLLSEATSIFINFMSPLLEGARDRASEARAVLLRKKIDPDNISVKDLNSLIGMIIASQPLIKRKTDALAPIAKGVALEQLAEAIKVNGLNKILDENLLGDNVCGLKGSLEAFIEAYTSKFGKFSECDLDETMTTGQLIRRMIQLQIEKNPNAVSGEMIWLKNQLQCHEQAKLQITQLDYKTKFRSEDDLYAYKFPYEVSYKDDYEQNLINILSALTRGSKDEQKWFSEKLETEQNETRRFKILPNQDVRIVEEKDENGNVIGRSLFKASK